MKDIINFIIRLVLSGLLLWYLFSKIDVETTMAMIKAADVRYLVMGLGVFFVLNIVLLFRWLVLIRALDLNAPFFTVARYFLIGLFGNLFLPSAIGGDIIKILGLCKNSSQKPRVVASVLLDRLTGFAGLVIIATVSFVIGFRTINDMSIFVMIMAVAALSLMVTSVLFNERIYSFGCKVFNPFPKVKKSLMDMHYDIQLLKNKPNPGYVAIFMSSMNQIGLAFMWYLLAIGLGVETNFMHFIMLVPLTCVVAMLPSIGGLGVREAGSVYLFSKVGIDSGVVVSISLTNFLCMVVVGLLGGLVYVITLSSGRVQPHTSNVNLEPEKA